MKQFLSVLLIGGLHFSVCTGGMFSVATAIAADFGQMHQEEVLMSPAIGDVFLCGTETPAGELHHAADDVGCGESDTCLRTAQSDKNERYVFDTPIELYEPTVAYTLRADFPVASSQEHARIRSAPLHEDSVLLAHALIKRE